MREIKFRAWYEWKKHMDKNSQLTSHFEEVLQDDCCILMQYTGLKDKNGKEIYEGDVVKSSVCIDGTGCEYTGVGVVKYSEYGNRGYCLFDNYESGVEKSYPKHVLDMMDFDLSGDYKRHYEVIGNIYENPELLK